MRVFAKKKFNNALAVGGLTETYGMPRNTYLIINGSWIDDKGILARSILLTKATQGKAVLALQAGIVLLVEGGPVMRTGGARTSRSGSCLQDMKKSIRKPYNNRNELVISSSC